MHNDQHERPAAQACLTPARTTSTASLMALLLAACSPAIETSGSSPDAGASESTSESTSGSGSESGGASGSGGSTGPAGSVPGDSGLRSIAALPASFTGTLPCADCPGISYHLDLFEGSAYYLRQSYLERDRPVDRIGSWSLDGTTATVALWGQDRDLIRFRLQDGNTLRLLDRDGRDIDSALNYTLTRAAVFEPTTLSLPLRGMYSYLADAGSFVECESGRRFIVAQEADNAALERAYSEARREPGSALLVSLDGEITLRAPMEGPGLRPAVVVREFTGIWPAETCGARMSISEMFGTNWELTRIGGDAVTLGENARSPRIVLGSTDDRLTGFSGCNNFTGSYRSDSDAISFGPIAATWMACSDGADLESRLFAALANVTGYELYRHHLEFYDSRNALLARFEARELQ